MIGKVDCRVFCHIKFNFLGDKISNTAAPIQPNPLAQEGQKVLKSNTILQDVRNGHINIQLMKQHMT